MKDSEISAKFFLFVVLGLVFAVFLGMFLTYPLVKIFVEAGMPP